MPKIAISKGFLIQFRKLGIDFRQKNVYSGISRIAFDFRPMGSFAGFSARLSLLKEGWFQIATSIAKACDVSIRKVGRIYTMYERYKPAFAPVFQNGWVLVCERRRQEGRIND
jgi:hypothetical protein